MKFDPATLKFDERGLVPVIAQEEETGMVLMLAWMNQEAISKTLSTRQVASDTFRIPWYRPRFSRRDTPLDALSSMEWA